MVIAQTVDPGAIVLLVIYPLFDVGPNAALINVAGYAILGGIFFLISAIRLHRVTAKVERDR